MKIIKDYCQLKSKHEKMFRNLSAEERIKKSEELIHLKKELDENEKKIISGILNYSLNYNRCFNLLREHNFHGFLKNDVGIIRFLMNRSISSAIGFSEEKRNEVLDDFKKLCEDVWADFIITTEERKLLDDYCIENRIDKTQQFLIEQSVSKSYTDGFDLLKVVEYYFLKENKSDSEIKSILIKEYKKDVEENRIKLITSQLNQSLSNELDIEEGKSKLFKTIEINNNSIYIIIVNGGLTSGFEFEIGFKEEETHSFKIIISKELVDQNDETRLIEVITDGICYYLTSNYDGGYRLKIFLELKPNVRELVKNSI